jgi:hypothetical protein
LDNKADFCEITSFFRLHLEVNGVSQVETTRKIIFANGVAGTGGAYIPTVLTDLPLTPILKVLGQRVPQLDVSFYAAQSRN